MLMKKIHYLALALVAGALVCGCSDEKEPSTQNRGKEKPVVTLTADEVDGGSFTFTIAASEQASQYAYAIFEGTGNPAPLAYDIVCDEVGNLADEDRENGNYSHYAFNMSDGASATHTFECEPQGKYEVFAAAITSTGLLSEVTKMTIEIPKIEFKAGNYTVSYTRGNGTLGKFATYIELDEEDPTVCYLYADWLGLFGQIINPILVGQVDVASKEVVFDGTCVHPANNGSFVKGFGATFYQVDLGLGFDCDLVFYGGGNSGKEPIVALMDNKGYLTDISYFEYAAYDSEEGTYVGSFACEDGVMTYVPEEDEPAENE